MMIKIKLNANKRSIEPWNVTQHFNSNTPNNVNKRFKI